MDTTKAGKLLLPGLSLFLALVLGGCADVAVDTTPVSPSSGATSTPATPPPPTSQVPQPTPTAQPSGGPTTPQASSAPAKPSAARVRRARTQLAALSQVDRYPQVPDYRREAFGSRWADVDGNGCNQRDDVLLRDAVPGTTTVQRQGRCDHDVLAGTWVDPYTGKTLVFTDLKDLQQAQAIQIDHVVPLAEAWRSGASRWQDRRRLRFANNLSNLLAVDGPTNAAKSAYDPASWRPRKAYQCQYALRWIAVKHRWGLAADPTERRALQEMLATC